MGLKQSPEYITQGQGIDPENMKWRLRDWKVGVRRNNVHLLGVPEGEYRTGESHLFQEVKPEDFPELTKDVNFSSGHTANPKQGIRTRTKPHTWAYHSNAE